LSNLQILSVAPLTVRFRTSVFDLVQDTDLVCIFDSQDELAVVMFRQ